MQILVLQHRLPQHRRLQTYGDQKRVETQSKFTILFHVKPSDFSFVAWFMFCTSLVFHACRLKFSEQKQKLSYYDPF